MLNEKQIKGKWNEIKGGVRNIWGNITDEELDQTNGNLEAIPGLVKKKYSDSNEEIKIKINRLLDSFDNETDKSLRLNDGISSYKRNPTSERNLMDKEHPNDEEGILRH